VTFDPFGDFEARGYLRNFANEKDLDIVRRLEHTSFTTGIDAAFERLAAIKRLSYQDVLETHKILFEAVYPWAGQDRLQTAPDLAVSKGPVLFARPRDIQRAVDWALERGQDKKFMTSKPGEIMPAKLATSSDYAATLRSAGMTLASIKATGGVSICSAVASGEKTFSTLFAALRVFLTFLGWFKVEASGFLPTLIATVRLATALTTLRRWPLSSRDSLDSSDSISRRRSVTFA
jgi:hypothetical protein